jgi:hypothetical protein
MMSWTVERLCDVATAVGAAVTEQDLPELQLAETVRRPADVRSWLVSRRWSGGRWLIPVIASASVLVAVGSATVLGQFLSRTTALPYTSPSPSPTLLAPVAGTPKYLVTSQEARGYVKSVATGQTIAKIPPPVKGYLIEGVAAAPGNRIFYLAGQVLDQSGGRLLFFRITLRSDGQPLAAQPLPGRSIHLPIPITSNGLVNIPIAVSPDGSQIAYTLPNQLLGQPVTQPTTIVVRSVSTGATKTWKLYSSGQTQVSELSWAANGQLGYVATIGSATVRNGVVVKDRGHSLNVLAILNTLRPSGQLAAATRLITYSSPPGGVQAAVITADGRAMIAQVLNRDHTTELAEISTATRKVIRVLLAGPEAAQANPVAIDGDNVLFTLSPKVEHPSGSYVCGHLALARLGTGKITGLPFPVYCNTVAPPPPFYAAW